MCLIIQLLLMVSFLVVFSTKFSAVILDPAADMLVSANRRFAARGRVEIHADILA